MRFALFWVSTQLIVVIPRRRFDTTYRPYLRLKSWLEDLPMRCAETSISNQLHTPRNNPEQRISHLLVLRGGSLKSRSVGCLAQRFVLYAVFGTMFCAVCSVWHNVLCCMQCLAQRFVLYAVFFKRVRKIAKKDY
jgi:hypothetical protein